MRRRGRPDEALEPGDDSAYAAMTDMMVGVLFIFIVLLGVLSQQPRGAAGAMDALARAEGAKAALRAALTQRVADDLRAGGIAAPVAARAGLISFDAEPLFVHGRARLSPGGRRTAATLATALGRDGARALGAVQVIGQAGVDAATPEGRAAAGLALDRADAFARAVSAALPDLAPRIHAAAFSQGSGRTPRGGGGQAIGVQLVTAG